MTHTPADLARITQKLLVVAHANVIDPTTEAGMERWLEVLAGTRPDWAGRVQQLAPKVAEDPTTAAALVDEMAMLTLQGLRRFGRPPGVIDALRAHAARSSNKFFTSSVARGLALPAALVDAAMQPGDEFDAESQPLLMACSWTADKILTKLLDNQAGHTGLGGRRLVKAVLATAELATQQLADSQGEGTARERARALKLTIRKDEAKWLQAGHSEGPGLA